MAARKTTSTLRVLVLILPLFLLTSCSDPDSSGGVTLARGGGDDANEFPNGSCEGRHENTPDLNTGCGWIHVNERSYYIFPDADLRGTSLEGADLRHANLEGAILDSAYMPHVNLRYANLRGAHLHGANLLYAGLRDANLSGADLSSALLVFTVLVSANLTGANLEKATLREADLTDAELSGIKANPRTTCPNGIKWGTTGNNCGF